MKVKTDKSDRHKIQKGRGDDIRYKSYAVYRDNALKAGKIPRPYEGIVSDVDETKYDPSTALQRYIREHPVFSAMIGGVVGIGSNLLYPGSGIVTGPPVKLMLEQMGLGAQKLKYHKKHPVSTKFSKIQHGQGANLVEVFREILLCVVQTVIHAVG